MIAEYLLKIKKRRIVQWLLLPIVFIVIGLGWKYPILGYIVPLVMSVGIVGGFINGRYVCGHFCPRGAFYDRILSLVSPHKPIPKFLYQMKFRWFLLVLLISFMGMKGIQNPTSWQHWGYVFWQMCVMTTLVGIGLGLFFHQRAWCAFCPIGTLANQFNHHRQTLFLDRTKCISCKKCERVCPMQLNILNVSDSEQQDCLKCSECVAACPKNALRL